MLKKILIGNKCDLINERVVTAKQGQNLADEYGIKYFETSAKSNDNVKDSFISIATDIVSDIKPKPHGIIISKSPPPKPVKCCKLI